MFGDFKELGKHWFFLVLVLLGRMLFLFLAFVVHL